MNQNTITQNRATKTKKIWYKRPWGLILVVIFLPFFITWYAWAKSKWSKPIKIFVTVIMAVWVITALSISSKNNNLSNVQTTNNVTQKSVTKNNNNSKSQTPVNPLISQMSSWYTKYGAILSSITNDLGQISKDSSNQNESALLTDCQTLGTDVTTAQSYPAIPDNTTEQHWSSALTYLNSASQDCIQGLNNNDANQITQAVNEISQATTQLNEATNAINQITGN